MKLFYVFTVCVCLSAVGVLADGCDERLEFVKSGDAVLHTMMLPEAVTVGCVELVRYLLEFGVDPNSFGRFEIGMTALCLSYYALYDADEIEDEVLREEKLNDAREIHDLLLSYGAICDMSWGDRRTFIDRFSDFQTNLTENTVFAYVQDGQVLLLQGETQTVVDVAGSEIKDFEEWISRNSWLQEMNVAIIGISPKRTDIGMLLCFEIALEQQNIQISVFSESSQLFMCDIPALLQLFQTHTKYEIWANNASLLDTVCPPQGPISRIPTAMVEKLNAL